MSRSILPVRRARAAVVSSSSYSAFTRSALRLAAFAAVSTLPALRAGAVARTWDGSSSNDWNTAANWTPSGVPTTNDDVSISLAAANVTLGANSAGVNSLFISNSANLNTNGFTLNVDNGLNTSVLEINGLDSDLFVDSGAASGIDAHVELINVTNQGQLSMQGGVLLVDASLNVASGTVASGSGTIRFSSAGNVFTHNGTLAAFGTLTLEVTGGGTFDLDGGGNGVLSATAVGANTLNINAALGDAFSGTINIGLDDAVNFSQNWTADSSSQINFTGGVTASDDATLGGAGQATIAGNVVVGGFATIASAAVFNSTAAVTLNASSNLSVDVATFNGGAYTGAGTLVQTGDWTIAANTTIAASHFDWGNSTSPLVVGGGTNSITINPGVVLTINSTDLVNTDNQFRGVLQLNSGTLDVNTAAGWTLPAPTGLFPNNLPGGTLNLNNTGAGTPSVAAGAAITVAGSINASGAGLTTINPVVTFESTAAVTVAAGTTLEFNNNVTFGGGSYTGAGTLRTDGGAGGITVSADTTMDVDTFHWDGSLGTTDTVVGTNVTFTITSNQITAGNVATDGYDATVTLNSGADLIVGTNDPWRLEGTANMGNASTVGGAAQMVVAGNVNVVGIGASASITAPVRFLSTAAVSVPESDDALTLSGAITYEGGTYTGLGTINQNGNATVVANTTIDVDFYNLDGGGSSQTTISDGVTLTLTPTHIENGASDTFDGTLNLNGGTISINNTPNLWTMAGTLNLNRTGANAPQVSGDPITISGVVNTTGAGESDINPAVTINAAAITVAAGSELEFNGDAVLNGGSYTGAGTLRFDGGANGITVGANTTIGVATFQWDGSNGLTDTLVNSGVTFTINSTKITAASDPSGDGYDGALTLATNAALSVNTAAAWRLDGAANLRNGSSIGGAAQMDVFGALNVANGPATASVTAPVRFAPAAVVSVPLANDVLNLNGAITFDGGTYSGLGTINQNGNATVVSDTTVGAGLATYNWDGGGSSSMTVNAGVTFALNAGRIDTGVENYEGTLNLAGGTVNVNNTANAWQMGGVVNFSQPTLVVPRILGDAVTFTGTVNVAPGANANVNPVTILSAPTVAVGAGGSLGFLGNTTVNGGSYTGAGLIGFESATLVTANTAIDTRVTFDVASQLTVPAGITLALNGLTTWRLSAGPHAGAGTLVQTGNSNVATNTTINIATYDLDGALENAVTTVDSNRTLTIGSNNIELGGVNTFDGTVTLNGGTLQMNTPAAWLINTPNGTVNFTSPGAVQPALNGAQARLRGTINSSAANAAINANLANEGGTINVTAGSLTVFGTLSSTAGSNLTKTGAGVLRIAGPQNHNATASIAINGGTVHFDTNPGPAAPARLKVDVGNTGTASFNFVGASVVRELNLANGASALIPAGGNKVVATNVLTFAGTGTLDIADNDAIVNWSGTDPTAAILAAASAAYHAGKWDLPGLRSSTAAAQVNKATAIGIADNGAFLYPTFDGVGIDATTVLIKYTWYGDANVDGQVTAADSARLLNGFNNGLTGWWNGDFNYSGTITADDFALFSLGAAFQTGILSTAVPEPLAPTTLVLAALASSAIRRRRK